MKKNALNLRNILILSHLPKNWSITKRTNIDMQNIFYILITSQWWWWWRSSVYRNCLNCNNYNSRICVSIDDTFHFSFRLKLFVFDVQNIMLFCNYWRTICRFLQYYEIQTNRLTIKMPTKVKQSVWYVVTFFCWERKTNETWNHLTSKMQIATQFVFLIV